jgi:Transposase DDE domain
VIGGKRAPVPKGMGGWKSGNWSPAPNASAWLAAWPGVEQAFCLQRTSFRQGQWHTQTVYGITNLSPQQASAGRLLELVRRHWAIENRLHWRRDVTLREDHSQVRKGNAPQVWAVLNNLILAVLDFLGVQNVPKQMRVFDAQPQRAVRLLFGSLLTFR